MDKFEFKCLTSITFSQMSSKNFLCGYQFFQLNSMSTMSEISQISTFVEGKISTVKIYIFKLTVLIILVIFQSHVF